MRACPASWRWTSDRALLTARGPLRRTSRTPHRPGSPVPGFPEHAVDKQNGCSVASTAPLNRTTASLEEDTTAGRLHSHYSPERSPGRHRRPHRRSGTHPGGRPVPGRRGLTAGMTLEQAMSLQTDTVVLDAGEPYYRRLFDRVLRALQGVTDRVEAAGLGTAYLRIDGLERLHRGEARAVSALLNAVPAYLRPRLAVADSKFPAYVAARTSPAHGASRVPEDAATFLAPHPVELLPIPSKVKTEMRRLGLHAMGQVASLGERRLTDRSGLEGRRAWRLCNGTGDEAIHPMAFVETVAERMSLSFPTSLVHALSLVVDTLLRRAFARPEMRGRYAGRASLLCCCDRVAVLGEEHLLQGARRQVGERIVCRPEQTGVGPAGHSRGGGDAHPLRPDGRARDPDGALRRSAQGPGAEDSGDGAAAAGQAGRGACAVQGGGGGSLAPCAGDAGPAGARGPLGAGGRQAAPLAGARGDQGRGGGRAWLRAVQETLAACGADRRPVDVRPVVAPEAGDALLLPHRPRRRQAVDPVP